ncbi:helix-turn-helix domain-containing protein [Arthrobacter psychrolactophilus]
MADYRAIMALLLQGRSYRQIVDAVGCSHRDVSAARKTLDDRGLNAGALAEMSDVELAGLFPDGRSKVSAGYDLPDFAQVVKSMKANPHFTLLQSWRAMLGPVPC